MPSASASTRCLLLIGSLLLLTLSTACTRSPASGPVLARTLPPTPSWAKPVAVSRPADGTDWEIVARREQNGRKLANGRLTCLVDWVDERRAELAGKGSKPIACEVRK